MRRTTMTLAAALVLVSAVTTARTEGQPSAAPVRSLVPGSSIRQLAPPASTSAYTIELRANDFLDLAVVQDEVAVRLQLVAPSGDIVSTMDVPASDPFPLRMIVRVSSGGTYRLQVYAHERGGRAGDDRSFTLNVRELRPATAADAECIRLAALLARAGRLALNEQLADLDRSIPLYLEAAAGWRAIGERELEAATVRSLGSVTGLFTQYRTASASAYRRLIELTRELGHPEQESHAHYWLALEYSFDGQIAKARDAVLESARLSVTFANRAAYSRDLQFAAFMEMQLGNYQESRQLAGQALEVAVAIGNLELEALALAALAELQALSGDVPAAIEQQARAAALSRGLPPHHDFLNKLGLLYLGTGDVNQAEIHLNEALSLASRFTQRESEALTRMGLGDVALVRGDRTLARRRYQETLAILLEGGSTTYRCWLESRFGTVDLRDGRFEAAGVHFAAALALSRDVTEPACEANSRDGLADLAIARGRLDEAQAHAMRVVQLHDEFREASSSIEARTVGFARLAPAYERAVDITIRLANGDPGSPHIAEALALNERARARGLLDALMKDHMERSAHAPPALEHERRQLRETWHARVVEHEAAQRWNASARAAALADEMAALSARLREIEARIDATDPRHAAFTRPKVLALADIQRLLDEDTVLVEYALGEAHSYVWVVDTQRVRALTLAPRAAIEAAVRRAHRDVAQVPDGSQAGALDARSRISLNEVARLIVDPIAPWLTKRRLVFVTPDALALVPFGALPGRRAEAAADDAPLLARFEIVSLPSASVLSALRTNDDARRTSSKTAVVFADPVYERDDPRLDARARPTTATERSTAPLPSERADVPQVVPRGWSGTATGDGVSLTRLPFSRREADAIRRYASDSPLILMGLDATRERALSSELADYRIVHFAAHGLLQPTVPNLSGLALSLVDAGGRARNGFLMLPDIYDLTLNADLVVLSACETALGNEIRGEGVVGLPRGFMYAGAARVVSSLWRVDDEATAVLMDGFYRRMLGEKMAPAAALRAAQLDLRRLPRWQSPFFWAGFVLQGDWR